MLQIDIVVIFGEESVLFCFLKNLKIIRLFLLIKLKKNNI